jgi:hypothetical protein
VERKTGASDDDDKGGMVRGGGHDEGEKTGDGGTEGPNHPPLLRAPARRVDGRCFDERGE